MKLYKTITTIGTPFLNALLRIRQHAGKEDPDRLPERKGIAALPRPAGLLYWVHAASVGEAQSALILIDALLKTNKDLNILITTGTVTSAELMEKRLPERCIHQFYPVDQPSWVTRFLDHWQPDMAFWMESELWPNMLLAIKKRNIPAALVNARMSRRSFAKWDKVQDFIRDILGAFTIILAQTEEDGFSYRALGAQNVVVTDNLKFSAAPLPVNENDLSALKDVIGKRPLWVYASTHAGEEELACRVHKALEKDFEKLLTIIVPRHPHRRDDVTATCHKEKMRYTLRGEEHALPQANDQLYIVDTMGELGMIYRLSSIAMVGRAFSKDGGGGHNLIEPAALNCAVITGPKVQNQQKVMDEMDIADAARQVMSEEELIETLHDYLSNPAHLKEAIDHATRYAQRKAGALEQVMDALMPVLKNATARQEAA